MSDRGLLQGIALSKMAYISAETEAAATISGPPTTLKTLFASTETFRRSRNIKLPITAAFHASHLGCPDIEGIMGSLAKYNNLPVRQDVQFISTSSGQPINARNLRELLQQIILDTLQEPLRWSKVAQRLVLESEHRAVHVINAGSVRAANSLLRAMETGSINVLKCTEMQPPRQGNSSNSSSDIAIVGIASRMPESETLEEIWSLLEAGRDVHKKVSLRIRLRGRRAYYLPRSLAIDSTLTRIVTHPEKPRTL